MLRNIIHKVGLPLRTLASNPRVVINRGSVVRVLRATSPESLLSRLVVRVLGGRLSYNFVSSFLNLSIFLLRNAGFAVGFFINNWIT